MASSLYNKLLEINNIKNQKITVSNLKTGVNAYGVNGNFTSDATATTADIAKGKTAYVNGVKYTGTLNEYSNLTNAIPMYNLNNDPTNQMLHETYITDVSIIPLPNNRYGIPYNSILRNMSYTNISYNSISRLLNINPIDIKKGIQILDITGQYDASTEFQGIKMDPVTPSDTAVKLTSSIREISGLAMNEGTNLAYYFSNLPGLMHISNLNMTNVTNMWNLTQGSYNITSFTYVNMYKEDSAGVSGYQAFKELTKLNNFDNVILPKTLNDSRNMFYNCFNLPYINCNINISGTYMNYMFYNCSNLKSILNINIACKYSPDMNYMFYNCQNLDICNLDFSGMNMGYSNYLLGTFEYIKTLNDNNIIPFLEQFNRLNLGRATISGSGVTAPINFKLLPNVFTNDATYLYSGCENIKTLNVNLDEKFRFANHPMLGMFSHCYNLTEAHLKTSYSTTLAYTFANCNNLINVSIDINNKYRKAFYDGTFSNDFNLKTINFNENLIPSSLFSTFSNCYNLENLNINFITNNYVLNCINTFQNCYSLKEIHFMNNSMNMFNNSTANMFVNCYNLVSLGNLNNIYGISRGVNMFNNCPNLTGEINLYGFSTATLQSFYNTFDNCGFNKISFELNSSYLGDYTLYGPIIQNCNNLTDLNMNINSTASGSYANRADYSIRLYPISGICNNLSELNINAASRNINIMVSTIPLCSNIHNVNLTFGFYENMFRNLYYSISGSTNVSSTYNINTNLYNIGFLSLTYNNINAKINYNMTNCNNLKDATLTFTSYSSISELISNVNYCNRIMVHHYNDDLSLNVYMPNGINYLAFYDYSSPNTTININAHGNNITMINLFRLNTSNINMQVTNTNELTNFSTYIYNMKTAKLLGNINYINNGSLDFSSYDNNHNLYINYQAINSANQLAININCFNYSNIDIKLDNCVNINYFYMKFAIDYSNIVPINLNLSMNNFTGVNRWYLSGTNSFTNNSYDNILGILGNLTYYNANKRITNVFQYTNKDAAFWTSLPNYSNLANKGWTV